MMRIHTSDTEAVRINHKATIIILDLIAISISAIPLPKGFEQNPIYVALFAFIVLLALFSTLVITDKMPFSKERYEGNGKMHYSVYYMVCSLISSVALVSLTIADRLSDLYPFMILLIIFMFIGDYFVKVRG